MTRPQGSVRFPDADVAAVMTLATSLIRAANLMQTNADRLRQATSATVGARRWQGSAASAFADAADRRTDHATRAAVSFRAAGEALVRHGHVVHHSIRNYDAAAEGELLLRRNSPNATAAINDTITAQAQSVAAVYNSAGEVGPIVEEAANEFSQMANRADVDAVRPETRRDTARDDGFGWDDVFAGGAIGRRMTLDRIDRGTLRPEPTSRLGAYAATAGYPPGSVGDAVHRAIGTIYVTLGTIGEEQIGIVFNSPEARAMFDKPLTEETSRRMAEIEYDYWRRTRDDNPLSIGGQLGSAFRPWLRDVLQREVFTSGPRRSSQ
jgi:hypothetical protein